MSTSGRSQLPAFGVSRSRARKGADEQHYSESLKIPIIDIRGSQGQAGDFGLNAGDGLLYYHNSQQWMPVAVHGGQRTEGDRLVAADDPLGDGGDLYLSSGQGGIADGEIIMETGGEPALTIKKNGGGVIVKSGDLHLEDPSASIKCHIARAQVTAVHVYPLLDDEDEEETVSLSAVELNSMTSILTVKLSLAANEIVSGIINNELLQEDSWLAVTIVNRGSGVPHVWLSELQDGAVQYNICCFGGELSCLDLHLKICN